MSRQSLILAERRGSGKTDGRLRYSLPPLPLPNVNSNMLSKHLTRVALAATLIGLVPLASAQELPLRTTQVEDRTVVMMPAAGPGLTGGLELPLEPGFSGASSLAGVDVQVSREGEWLTYRADYLGRTYTAYANMSGPPARFAFDTAERRFRTVSPTILVELDDYDVLEQLVLERGALMAKPYPQLGFALIELPVEADPAEAVEFLDADPRLRDASVLFEPAARRPMNVLARDVRPLSVPGAGEAPANAKESLTPNVFMYTRYGTPSDPALVAVPFVVRNSGGADSEAASLRGAVFTLVPDITTPDPDDLRADVKIRLANPIPALDAKGAPYSAQFELGTLQLDANATYYVDLVVYEGTEVTEESERIARSFTGFTLDSLKRVQHVCVEPGRSGAAGTTDPLLAGQWHLNNTAQTAYADAGGVAGEDLGMEDVLASGPNGEGVKVAVVDTGLELCHPDLRDSVEHGASFNFNADAALADSDRASLVRMDVSDPFNFESTGGHGNSIAGLIAATAENGIGGRGIAPEVQLRGYNGLNAERQFRGLLDSLGVSTYFPDSTDAHVFNMSFGSSAPEPSNIDVYFERVFTHGVRNLRSGLGAIFVKAVGNDFRDCSSLMRDINESLGCGSSNGDDWSNLPYVIAVGAFNADGVRSSYSSAGPNLWISAPGGEYGDAKPSLLTVDQMGWDRGFGTVLTGNPLDDESTVNPDGDYTGRMNGTSAAAATVTGAVAVLLSEQPELTWRDVKHILAGTARQIDPDIAAVSETIGTVSRTLRLAWTENAAGFKYHDWYGFGAVDLDAAVEMAEDYTPDSLGEFRETSWFEQATSIAIPDNDGTGVTQTVNVSGLPDDATVEAVLLEVDISHEFPNDLGIHLVSPGGTRSVVNQVYNETLAVDIDPIRWRLLSNAFYGEDPGGDWQIEVFDADAEDTGDLDGWRLKIYYGAHPEEEEDDGDTGDGGDGDGGGGDSMG